MPCDDVCIDMYCDELSVEFYSEAIRRARKPHQCGECHAVIPIGVQYEAMAGKSDGDFWSERTCLACVEIRKAFVCGPFVMGQLWEEIREQLFPTWNAMKAIDCLAKLTTDEAIAKMRAEYAKFTGSEPVSSAGETP